MLPWKQRKWQILPVTQNLSSIYFPLAKFQLVSSNPSLAIIWQMTYTQKMPKLSSATLRGYTYTPAPSSGASFFASSRRARNASDWWCTARDREKGTDCRRSTSRPLSPSRLPLRAHFHRERDVWVPGSPHPLPSAVNICKARENFVMVIWSLYNRVCVL